MLLAYPLSDLTELPTQCYLVTMQLRLTGGQVHPLLFSSHVLFLIWKTQYWRCVLQGCEFNYWRHSYDSGAHTRQREMLIKGSPCWDTDHQKRPHMPSLIAGPHRTHLKVTEWIYSRDWNWNEISWSWNETHSAEGAEGGMEWEAYKTVRLKEEREKCNSGRQEGGQRWGRKKWKISQDVKFPCQNTQLTKPDIVTSRKTSTQIAGSLVKKWKT